VALSIQVHLVRKQKGTSTPSAPAPTVARKH